MVVVDELDEWLHFRPLLSSLLAHAAGDLRWVAFDTGDESVGESVGLGAVVDRLNDDNLRIGLVLMSRSIASSHPANATCVSRIKNQLNPYLLSGVSASSDDGHTADLEDCEKLVI